MTSEANTFQGLSTKLLKLHMKVNVVTIVLKPRVLDDEKGYGKYLQTMVLYCDIYKSS